MNMLQVAIARVVARFEAASERDQVLVIDLLRTLADWLEDED